MKYYLPDMGPSNNTTREALRSRPRPRILASGVLEYWSIGVLRFPRIAPRNRELGAVLHHSVRPDPRTKRLVSGGSSNYV
jgi:hypothetical protein